MSKEEGLCLMSKDLPEYTISPFPCATLVPTIDHYWFHNGFLKGK